MEEQKGLIADCTFAAFDQPKIARVFLEECLRHLTLPNLSAIETQLMPFGAQAIIL